jgi:hypothetical protein
MPTLSAGRYTSRGMLVPQDVDAMIVRRYLLLGTHHATHMSDMASLVPAVLRSALHGAQPVLQAQRYAFCR